MGTARNKYSRKNGSKIPVTTTDRKESGIIQDNTNINNSYESFPIFHRMGRSRSLSGGTSSRKTNIFTTTTIRQQPDDAIDVDIKVNETSEDPGNPLGNAVDYCVNNLQILHTRSNSILNSCPEPDIDKLLEDLFLFKLKFPNTDGDSNEGTKKCLLENDPQGTSQVNSMVISSDHNKKGKHGWKKKTLMIIPGKKLIRSISMKRKKSETNDDTKNVDIEVDDEQSLLWKGILQDEEPGTVKSLGHTVSKIESCDSEDSLFAGLDGDANMQTSDGLQLETPGGPSVADNTQSVSCSWRSRAKSKTTKKEEGETKTKVASLGSGSSNEGSKKEEKGPCQPQEGILKAIDSNDCDLFFSPSSLCVIPATRGEMSSDWSEGMDHSKRQEQKEKGDVKSIDVDCLRDSKAFSESKPMIKSSSYKKRRALKNKVIVSTGSIKTNKHKVEQDEEIEHKIEFEMILDDSRFGTRQWRKITSWKKHLTNSSAHSSSSSTSRRGKIQLLKRSLSPDTTSKRKSNQKNFSQDSNDQESLSPTETGKTETLSIKPDLVSNDVDQSPNHIEPRSGPSKTSSNRTGQNIRIMGQRRLQSALRLGTFSSSNQNVRRKYDPKSRQVSSRKMLVVSDPSMEELQQTTKTNQTDHDMHRAGIFNEITGMSMSKSNGEEVRGGDKSENSTNPSTESDPLQYSESDEEENHNGSISRTSNICNGITAREVSSTSILGLHELSWGALAGSSRMYDDANMNEADESVLLFGGFIGDHYLEGDEISFGWPRNNDVCYRNVGEGEDYSYYDEEDDITNHDGWIMDQDQLASFSTDDDTRRTSEYSFATSSNYSLNSYDNHDEEEDSVDRDFREAIIGVTRATSCPETSARAFPGKRKKASNNTSRRIRNFATRTAALSSSIRKSFSHKKKEKSKGTIDISSDVSIKTSEFGEKDNSGVDHSLASHASMATVEVILRTKKTPMSSTVNDPVAASSEARDDSSTIVSRENAADQTRGVTATTAEKGTESPERIKKRSNRRWRTLSSSETKQSHNDIDVSPSNDIITVVTKTPNNENNSSAVMERPKITKKKSNRYFDRRAALLDQNDDKEYESHSSSSNNSRSWARTDEDIQAEDSKHGYDNFKTSPEVIRE